MQQLWNKNNVLLDFPRGTVDKNSSCQHRVYGLDPCSREISRHRETKPMCHNYWASMTKSPNSATTEANTMIRSHTTTRE